MGFYGQFNELVTAAVLRVALPAFAAKHRSGTDLNAAYDKTLAIYTVIAWSSFGTAWVLMPEVIYVLFGAQWKDAVPLARIAALGALVYPLFAFSPSLLTAIGHARKRVTVQLLLAPLVVGTALLTSLISLEAMLFGGLFCAFVAASLYTFHLQRLMGYGWKRLLRVTGSSAAVAAASTVSCAVATLPFNSLDMGNFATLVWGGSWGLIAWLVAVLNTRHPVREYILLASDRTGSWLARLRSRM
jgi:O-antigen/teichoic acid export membrane protein